MITNDLLDLKYINYDIFYERGHFAHKDNNSQEIHDAKNIKREFLSMQIFSFKNWHAKKKILDAEWFVL